MDLSSLKEQLRDQFKELLDRIQESSLYIELKEKFELLPSRIQKLIIVGVSLMVGLFLFSIPYGNLSDSWLYEEQFVDNRGLIRDLLRASSTLKETSPLPTSASVGALESQVRRAIEEMRLTPEQIGNIQVIPGASTRLASEAVNQEAISVQLKMLNLRQVTDLSFRLQNLGAGIQPISFQMQRSSGQTHYFDVIYRIFQFSLKVDSENASGDNGNGNRPRARGGR